MSSWDPGKQPQEKTEALPVRHKEASLVYREQSWIKLKEGFKLLNFYRKEAGQEHPAANVDHFLWKTGVTGAHPGSEKREENFSRDVGQQVGMRWMPS